MKLKIGVFPIIFLMLFSSVFALDLSDFPDMFIKGNSVDTIIIVGKSAKAEDVLGAIDIVVTLQNEIKYTKIDIAKLDNEVSSLSAQNSIIIGGPCANAAAAKLLGYPANCLEGFEVGKGYIKLYEWNNGNIALLVAGTVALDTRRATSLLANYKDYTLEGTSMVVSGFNLKDIQVTPK